MQFDFRQWLVENEFRNSSKNPFYPPAYGGKGLYPPLSFSPQVADAITFFTPEERAWRKNGIHHYHYLTSYKWKMP